MYDFNRKSIICQSCKIYTNKYRREYCFNCYRKLLKQNIIAKLPIKTLPSELSQEQKDILAGSMLGDGNLSLNITNRCKNARLTIRRSVRDKEYLLWEAEKFKEFLSEKSIKEYKSFGELPSRQA